MTGGLCQALGSPVRAREVDLDDTQQLRRSVHEQVRRREHLIRLLVTGPVDEDQLWIAQGQPER